MSCKFFSGIKQLVIILVVILFVFTNCSHYVMRSYKKSEKEQEQNCDPVIVRIHPSDSIADKLGEIIMDDLGLSINCSESETIEYLKKEACSINSDIILIKEIKRPDRESYCYRCTGAFYKLKPKANPIQTKKYFEQEKINKREQKDRKKKIERTAFLIGAIRHWAHIIAGFGKI